MQKKYNQIVGFFFVSSFTGQVGYEKQTIYTWTQSYIFTAHIAKESVNIDFESL